MNHMWNVVRAGVSGLVLLAACSRPETTTAVTDNLVAAAVVPGYVHALAHSRFALGANPTSRTEFGLQKTIGQNGVFGTVISSGWAMGIPNADSPTRAVAPLSESGDVHNQAVRDYFVGAGLPTSQIGTVTAHASVYSVKGPADGPGPTPLHLGNYSSVISRAIDGIPVADSFAWAIMNANTDVVEESVYWPEVPQSAVDDAEALRAVVSDPVKGPAFVASLPKTFESGQVVIHHTPCVGGAAEAKATYDVIERGQVGMANQRHFSLTGQGVVLAAESIPVAPNTPKRKR